MRYYFTDRHGVFTLIVINYKVSLYIRDSSSSIISTALNLIVLLIMKEWLRSSVLCSSSADTIAGRKIKRFKFEKNDTDTRKAIKTDLKNIDLFYLLHWCGVKISVVFYDSRVKQQHWCQVMHNNWWYLISIFMLLRYVRVHTSL